MPWWHVLMTRFRKSWLLWKSDLYFSCHITLCSTLLLSETEHEIYMTRNVRKCTIWHMRLTKTQISLRSVQSAVQLISLYCPPKDTSHSWLSKTRPAKIQIRLRECAGWSESSLGNISEFAGQKSPFSDILSLSKTLNGILLLCQICLRANFDSPTIKWMYFFSSLFNKPNH